MNKRQKWLMWTILAVALVQMPALALSPAIHLIQTKAFPGRSLAEVQTVMGMTNLVSPLTSIAAAFLINRGAITKKAAVVGGLLLLALTGALAAVLHTEFWHLYLLSVMLGLSTGCFMTNIFGIMFDNFDDATRELVAGYQTSAINTGGILLGLAGGLLATAAWYGGYLLFLLGLPIAVLSIFTVPSYRSPSVRLEGEGRAKSRLNPGVYYYAALACVFMMIYGVCVANISTHLSGIGGAATSGVATAIQMGGGVVSGLFFGRLSARLKDMIMAVSCAAVFVGYMTIGLFASVLPMILVGVFITGMSLSLMLPRCMYAVSTLVDKSTSATATVIASSVAPSLGGFLSPVVFTNLTVSLGGESTVFRYEFVACVALAFGLFIAAMTARRARREGGKCAEKC